MRNAIVVLCAGLAVGVMAMAQPGPEGDQPDPILQTATPVERAILQRLDRIERGLFRENSILPRSVNDSLEQRLEHLLIEVRGGGGAKADPPGRLDNEAARVRDLDQDLRDLDQRVEREIERPVEQLTRRVADVEREVDRLTTNRDDSREIENLRRSLGRIERQIASIERRIR